MTSGKVLWVKSDPKSFAVLDYEADPPEIVEFNQNVDSDDLVVAAAAKSSGGDVDVSGTAPSCSSVTAK